MVYFLKLDMCVYVRAKFEVSSIILTSFRQGEGGNFNPLLPQNKPLKSPPRLGLKQTITVQTMKAVFYKFYLVYSLILSLVYSLRILPPAHAH